MRKLLTLIAICQALIFAMSAYSADIVTLRAAHVFKTDFSAHKAVADFAQRLEKMSNGTIKVEIYPNQQLGNERECLEGASLGSHDIALTGAAGWAVLNPKLGTFELPFLYRDMEHQRKVFTSDMKEVVDNLFSEIGLKFLAYYAYGLRSTLTTKKEIVTMDDFKGLKIRVPEVPIFVQTFKALGANPTPINYGETYTGLQTNVVEGVEGSPESMVSMKFVEICKYYTLTRHQSPPILMAINKARFEKFTPDQQNMILEAASGSGETAFDNVLKANEDAIQTMKDSGIKVNTPSPELLSQMESAVQVVYDDLGAKYGGNDLIQQIKAIK